MDISSSDRPNTQKSLQIRHAATVLVLRKDAEQPSHETVRVLMGKRADKAAFMPNKFVFPGGAVDPEDYTARQVCKTRDICWNRLAHDAPEGLAHAALNAAARELSEETGLTLQDGAELTFVFRAITPPGRTRRFDARFFVAWAGDIENDLDDFTNAENELSDLQWVSLPEAFKLDIPVVTKLALEAVQEGLSDPAGTRPVPFYDMRKSEGQLCLIP